MGNIISAMREFAVSEARPFGRAEAAERQFRLCLPFLRLLSGESRLAPKDELSADNVAMAVLSLFDILPNQHSLAHIGLDATSLNDLAELPRQPSGYRLAFSDLMGAEEKRAEEKFGLDQITETFNTVKSIVAGNVAMPFGKHALSTFQHFDGLIIRSYAYTCFVSLTLAIRYAVCGDAVAFGRIAPIMRQLPQIIPIGFAIGEGYRLRVLCA